MHRKELKSIIETAEGLPLTEIASITNSSLKRILRAYAIPLTEKEKAKLETYKKR